MRHGQQSTDGAVPAFPVTLAEAKEHVRVYHNDDDAYIEALIGVCTEFTETVTGRTLVRREVTVRTAFPQGAGLSAMIGFDRVPVDSVTSVAYVDRQGASVTLDPSAYRVETGERGLIYPASGAQWPETDQNAYLPVTIVIQSGYAPSADSPPQFGANVPKPLRQAILLLIGHMFEHREAVAMGVSAVTTPLGYDALIYPYRVRLGI